MGTTDEAGAKRQPQRLIAVVAALVLVFGFGVPVLLQNWAASLPPLDLDVTAHSSAVVVDRDGRLLRPFTTSNGRWRLPVHVAEVDPKFVRLLTVYEDKNFWRHHGIDWTALLRAAGQLVGNGRIVSGASTLSMQVARLLEPRTQQSLGAKLRQIVRARQIEARLGKTEILDRYLMLAPYGGNIEGVRAASLAYFGKEPKRLSWAEAALLVAVPQSPESRRPDRSVTAARRARDRVLDRAVGAGLLTPTQAAAAKGDPVPRMRIAFPSLAPHLAETTVKAAPDRRVHRLSLDRRLQGTLETLARDAAERLGPKISAAIVVIDNATGAVLAHVGTADYLSKARAGGIDMALAVRSPGSALKPLIYAMAFEAGIAHPETILDDRPSRYGLYAPENFDLSFQGTVTARHALQMSLNVPAVELLAEVGPERFLARLRSAGAAIVLPKDDGAASGLAVGLGGLGIRLIDLTTIFAGFARGGSVPDVYEGLDVPTPAQRQRKVTEPVAAWYVADILRGAPPPVNALGGRIAFKTGTSYGYRDAFAVGFDKRITIGVWVGRADNEPVPGLVGRQVAAPVLFDAFARYGGAVEPVPAPRNVLVATSASLPPPLRHLRKDAPKTIAATAWAPLRIAFPPDGAMVELGLGGSVQASGDVSPLALKAEGGVLPLTWVVNGLPVTQASIRRTATWLPDGAGFARVSVIDSKGATDTVSVRLR